MDINLNITCSVISSTFNLNATMYVYLLCLHVSTSVSYSWLILGFVTATRTLKVINLNNSSYLTLTKCPLVFHVAILYASIHLSLLVFFQISFEDLSFCIFKFTWMASHWLVICDRACQSYSRKIYLFIFK